MIIKFFILSPDIIFTDISEKTTNNIPIKKILILLYL